VHIDDVEAYRSVLEDELARHAAQSVELLIVDDIAEWASSRTISNYRGNPPAMSVTDGATGQWGILIRRSIRADRVASILDRIECGGFLQTRSVLNSPQALLRQTVLHELAHLQNGWSQEREEDCDGWAFDRLGHAGA